MRKCPADGTGAVFVAARGGGGSRHFVSAAKTVAPSSVPDDLSIPFTSFCAMTFAKKSQRQANGLICRCAFDSQVIVAKPIDGPSGMFLSSRFAGGEVGNTLAVPSFPSLPIHPQASWQNRAGCTPDGFKFENCVKTDLRP